MHFGVDQTLLVMWHLYDLSICYKSNYCLSIFLSILMTLCVYCTSVFFLFYSCPFYFNNVSPSWKALHSFIYFFFYFRLMTCMGVTCLSVFCWLGGLLRGWYIFDFQLVFIYLFFLCLVSFLSFQYFFPFTCDASCDCCMLGRPKIKRVES